MLSRSRRARGSWLGALATAALVISTASGCGNVELAAQAPAPASSPPVTTPTASPSPSLSPSPTASAAITRPTALPTTTASPTTTPASTAPDAPAPSSSTSPPASDATAGGAVTAALALTVKGKAPTTGYARDQFGSGWVDVDRNGCDTRNDMLILRLEDRDMSGSCKVLSGDLADPYTGTWVHFERGGKSEVDIDHVVALKDAWIKGAASWEFAKRVAFANDPLNLEPAEASANRQKGAGDAATWLPSYKPFRCAYVARQVAVKTKYGLWMTQPELDAVLRVLKTCPDQALPDAGTQPVIADNIGPAPAPQVPTTPAPEVPMPIETATPADVDERFPYCKDLPSGYGPYVSGVDPEYEWYRDGDDDGVVCD